MSGEFGFTYKEMNGEFQIFHHGKKAVKLRGIKAKKFKDEIEFSDSATLQHIMARLTGNFKRGNEKIAKNHPRNRK